MYFCNFIKFVQLFLFILLVYHLYYFNHGNEHNIILNVKIHITIDYIE